jgi:hypothetical protein
MRVACDRKDLLRSCAHNLEPNNAAAAEHVEGPGEVGEVAFQVGCAAAQRLGDHMKGNHEKNTPRNKLVSWLKRAAGDVLQK